MTMEYVLEMTPISTFVAPFVLLCMMGALIVTIAILCALLCEEPKATSKKGE